ncbi:MAG TPA: biopolymer transporter ExbD [Flavisolibacter sp.]|jgi:hypothetical protein|nr:biopolymer transporter ExbD [Flavisolibacter sp.]
MAQAELQTNLGSKRKIHALPRIDMTPMVDLGFLLITFFIFTTSMAEPRATNLVMPKEGDPTRIKESRVLHAILLAGNKVLVYEGQWQQAAATRKWKIAGFDEKEGLGYLIRQKQEKLQASDGTAARGEMVLLIKPTRFSSYKNLVDALDEALINAVEKFMIIDPDEAEVRYAAKL